ncbi:MAG: c-type cytochrome [Thermoanaerobaculia bacterium]
MIVAALVLLAATQPPDLPVEQTKKNIKVLHGLPSSQLIPVMAFMSNSLGVTCAYCHAKEWDSDEKPMKDVARRMIALQRTINDQQFAGKLAVTCNTCHQGRAIPSATPDVANAGWNRTPPNEVAGVPGELAIERLPEAPKGVMRRIVRGSVERYNGRDEPKSAPFTLTVDSDIQYTTELSHPPEATRAFVLYMLERPKPEQVRGERWTIAPEVVRRYRETATPLGNLPEEVELTDFRDTSSGRLPFRARWSRADYRVTFTVTEIESRNLAGSSREMERRRPALPLSHVRNKGGSAGRCRHQPARDAGVPLTTVR